MIAFDENCYMHSKSEECCNWEAWEPIDDEICQENEKNFVCIK